MKGLLAALLVLILAAAIGAGAWYFLVGSPMTTSPDSKTTSGGSSMGSVKTVTPPPLPQNGEKNFSQVVDVLQTAKEINKDTVAWLAINNTKINNAVLQSNNNFYYLRRNEQRKDEIYGCYFADYACNFMSRDSLLGNTVIYGHSDLKDNPEGPKFSELFRFTNEEFATKNRSIYLTTDADQLEWEIFAVFYTDVTFDYITPELEGPARVTLGNAAMEKSLYKYGVEITPEDKLLTLSTCSVKLGKDREDIRFVVMARLLDEGEKPDDRFGVNPNPIMPK